MSNNRSNNDHSFVRILGILFLQMTLITALISVLVVSCGDDSAGSSTAPASSGGSQSGDSTPISVIGNLALEAVSADSVTVSWDALSNSTANSIDVKDPVVIYQVSASNDAMVINYKVAASVSVMRYTNQISGLSSDKVYQITVKAMSGSTTRSEGSLLVVPSGVEFSASNTVDKLATITDITNKIDTEMTVAWDEVSRATAYAVIAEEEQADLAGALEPVTKDKKIAVVCKLELTGADCPVLEINADGKPFTTLKSMIAGGKYTTIVLPLSFRDLIGLKVSDGEGNKIGFIKGVKNLIEESGSPAGKQAREVGEAIVNKDASVTNKAKVFPMSSREIGVLENLSVVNYSNQVHLSWEHASGANHYEAVLSNNSKIVTNTVDRKDAAQLFGGRTVFTDVGLGKYTVSVLPYFQNDKGVRIRKGNKKELSGEVKNTDSLFTPPNQVVGLVVTNHAPGTIRLSWADPETASLTRYDIYYYQGTIAPERPNYTAAKGETSDLVIKNIKPGSYTIRVDAVAGGVIVKGAAVSKNVYTTPDAPKLVNPWPSAIDNINSKLYHTAYRYTVLEGNPGGLTNNSKRTSTTASYRLAGGAWQDGSISGKQAIFSGSETDYGKTYEVKVTVKNPGGFESSTVTSFVFRSFPEPIKGNKVEITPDDRSLLVTWPETENTHSSKVAFYTVVLTDGDDLSLSSAVYGMTNVTGRSVVFDNLTNGKLYSVNVFSVSVEGWSLLSALGQKYNYPYATSDTYAVRGIFANYVGLSAQAKPIVKPGLVEELTVKATNRSEKAGAVGITWEASSIGSPADTYVVEYLQDVKPVLVIGNNNTAAVTNLNWSQAKSMTVNANSDPSNRNYVTGITGLNTTGVTNVFRVKAVNMKGYRGYEHFVLGTDPTSPPSPVKNIVFSSHLTNGFTVTWRTPDDGGRDRDDKSQSVTGYRVTLKKAGASAYEGTYDLEETILTYTVTGLDQGTEYEVLVQAKNNANGSALYNAGVTMNVWTPSLPSEVRNAAYSDSWADRTGYAGFTVSWSAPTDFGKKNNGTDYTASDLTYTVRLYDASSVLKANYIITGTSKAVTGLSPGNRYSVTVTSSNAAGAGMVVSGGETWTPSVPGVVTGLTARDYKTDGFRLTWIAPGVTGTNNDGKTANLTGYRVAYRAGNTGNYLTNFVSSGTSYTFSGLASGTGYKVQVIAMNAGGEGELHSSKRVWTGALPGDVGTVTAIARAANIDVFWLNVAAGKAGKMDDGSGSGTDLINYYVVEYKNDTAGTGYQLLTNTTATNVKIRGLTLSNTYQVKVTASNQTGISTPAESQQVQITEKERPPSPPGSITLLSADHKSIGLSWSPSRDAGIDENGNKLKLSNYVLQYSLDNNNWTDLTTSSMVKLTATLTNNTNVTVVGLTGGMTYYFRAAGVNALGMGNFSTVLKVDYILVTGITLTPSSLDLGVGDSREVTATFRPPNAINTDITWISSDTGMATVFNRGNGSATVTAVGGGVSAIWAAAGNVSNSVTVTVTPASPANFRQTSDKTTEIDLGWDPSPGTGTYQLFQIMDDGTTNSLSSLTGTTYTASGLTTNTYYRYQLKACGGNICSSPVSLLALTVSGGNSLAAIITAGKIPTDLSTYDQVAQDIFSGYAIDAAVVPRYVVAGGSGNKSGTSWANAADNLKTVLSGIYGSSTTVHAVLLGPGVYYAGAEMTMKNYVTIAGGISRRNTVPVNAAAIAGPTVLSGNKSHQVFNNNGINNTPRLYGVTIANGKAEKGGGMYNINSSPILTKVVFSGNTTSGGGGGMYNSSSSPVLTGLVFSGNTASDGGGGMYNDSSSSPVLTKVVFSSNRSDYGGGMVNWGSSPILTKVVFSGNSASSGGGMYIVNSTPILIKVIFSGNRADSGGGIYNSGSTPFLIGAVFSGNTASEGGGMVNSGGSASPIILNTILWGQNVYNRWGGTAKFYFSVMQGGSYDINTSNIVTTDPDLLPLTDNGGGIDTMAIQAGSSAVNKGVYVKRSGTRIYHSINKVSWITGLNSTPVVATPPDNAIDLTATDMTGHPTSDRPDIGVYEAR